MANEEGEGFLQLTIQPTSLEIALNNPTADSSLYPKWLLRLLAKLKPHLHICHDRGENGILLIHSLWDADTGDWWSFSKQVRIRNYNTDASTIQFVDSYADRDIEYNFSTTPNDLNRFCLLFVQSLKFCECQNCEQNRRCSVLCGAQA
jgi:hypothetical protein